MKTYLKTFLVSLLAISLINCAGNTNNTLKTTNPKHLAMIQELKESMISYMQEAEPMHTIKDIEECEKILLDYVNAMEKTTSKEAGMQVVKDAIIKLNKLNERCEEVLIETGEREQIAEIIITASADKGYNTLDEDITEEWREW